MFQEVATRSVPGLGGSLLEVLSMVTQSNIDDSRYDINPIAPAGKLGALQSKFPQSFKNKSCLSTIPTGCCAYSATIRCRLNCGTTAGVLPLAKRSNS